MSWSHMTEDSKIIVLQQKTGSRLLIPLHRDLLDALAEGETRACFVITHTLYGKAFTVDGFSQWMREAIRARTPLD